MRSAAAYAPGHVTGFFHIDDTASDPLEKGSLGAGFSIEAGVTTRVQLVSIPSSDPLAAPGNQALRTRILINGSVREDAVVSQNVVLRYLETLSELEAPEHPSDEELRSSLLSIEHQMRVPERSGFGTSGAGALSLSLALNELFGSPLTRTLCAQIAHLSEITCGTGLGTVIGEFQGGCEIRTAPGAPGVGAAVRFEPQRDSIAVALVFGPLETKSALRDEQLRTRINAAGRRYLDSLLKSPKISTFLRLSREFAEGTGLITERARTALDLFDENGIPASMLMFGDGVFTLVERSVVPKVRRMVDGCKEQGDLIVSNIEFHGGKVIHED